MTGQGGINSSERLLGCFLWARWLIQDTLKVLTYKLLFAFDIFQIKSGSRTAKDGRRPGEEQLLGVHVRAHARIIRLL